MTGKELKQRFRKLVTFMMVFILFFHTITIMKPVFAYSDNITVTPDKTFDGKVTAGEVFYAAPGDVLSAGENVFFHFLIYTSGGYPAAEDADIVYTSGAYLTFTKEDLTLPSLSGMKIYKFHSQENLVNSDFHYAPTLHNGVTEDELNAATLIGVVMEAINGFRVVYEDGSGDVIYNTFDWTELTLKSAPAEGTGNFLGWTFSEGDGSNVFEPGETIDIGDFLDFGEYSEYSLYPYYEEEATEKPTEEEDEEDEAPVGSASVSMGDYYYGTGGGSPKVTSSTNDVSKAVLAYKAAGAPDSAYSGSKPTEPGNYVVRATLPDSATHQGCSCEDSFTISYLPTPATPYVLTGTLGESGWYTSDVKVAPPEGYSISFGNRSGFGTEGKTFADGEWSEYFYLKDNATGAQTAAIALPKIQVDGLKPVINGVVADEKYFADEMLVSLTELNIKEVLVDGEKTEFTQEADGSLSIAILTGIKTRFVTINASDKAGNEAEVSFSLAPAWMEKGIVGEGTYYLEEGAKYSFPETGTWELKGDTTSYAAGTKFYINGEGERVFASR